MKKYSTKDFKKVLKKNGFILDRSKGSHLIYKNSKNDTAVIYTSSRGIAKTVTDKIIKRYDLVI